MYSWIPTHGALALLGLSSALPAPAGGSPTVPVAVSPPHTGVASVARAVIAPPPCVAMAPPPSAEETQARFDQFADAFLVAKNLTNAFEYISASYRVGFARGRDDTRE